MMTITEKAAYIKGLVEGMELDPNKKETKIIHALVDILDDLALSVADAEDDVAALQDEVSDIEEHLIAVDEDLADVEEFLYDDEDDEEDSHPCDSCGGWFDEEDDEEESDVYEVACPDCGEVFTFDESEFDSDEPLTCPKCGFVIDEIEFEDEE